jgi:hypothetical protein
MELELNFEPDEGRIVQRHEVQTSGPSGGFEVDTKRATRSKYNSATVVWHLMMGWGVGQIKPHTVDRGDLLPSCRCIMDTFSVSTATGYSILRSIRSALKIHQVNQAKRSERGDALTRAFKYGKASKKALDQFYWFQKRYLKA